MPLLKTILLPEGILGIWELTESVEQLIPYFSSEELSDPEFLKYTYEKRKSEWLCTRRLLKKMIGDDFRISYLENGKPILKNNRYNSIAISHSREFVTVLVHQQFDVGIDIENMNRNYTAIQKKYLSELEITQVAGIAKLQCLYWCAKEAIFKLVPEDGIEFREQIRILPFDPDQGNQFKSIYISGRKQITYQLFFMIFSDNCLVWVLNSPEFINHDPNLK